MRARGGDGRGARGAGDLRDRPRPLPRPGAHPPRDPVALDARRRALRAPPAPCSIRSSRSARACGWSRASRRRSRSRRSSRRPARAGLRAGRPVPRSARRAARARSRLDRGAGGAARARLTPADAARLPGAGRRISSTPTPRSGAPQEELRRNRGSQPLLWAIGVSGDWPILLATIDSAEGLPTLRQLLAAHHYWRRRGMTVDLVVLNTRPPSYLQELDDSGSAPRSLASQRPAGMVDQPGGVFVRRRDLLAPDRSRDAPGHGAGALACDGRRARAGSWRRRCSTTRRRWSRSPRRPVRARSRQHRADSRGLRGAGLRDRRLGGRARIGTAIHADRPHDGRAPGTAPDTTALLWTTATAGSTAEGDYEIRVDGDRVPPAPWANVIANPHGGFLVTRAGRRLHLGGQQLLLPAHALAQRPGERPASEVLYLRDEETRRAVVPDAGARSRRGPLHRPARRRASPPSSTSGTGIASRR